MCVIAMFTLRKLPCDKADVLSRKPSHVPNFYDHFSCWGQQAETNSVSVVVIPEENNIQTAYGTVFLPSFLPSLLTYFHLFIFIFLKWNLILSILCGFDQPSLLESPTAFQYRITN
jgi:hypothetical protein